MVDQSRVERTERIPQRRLAALLEVSGILASSLELPVVLQLAVQTAVEVLELDTGAIYLLDDEELFLGAAVPPLPEGFPDPLRRALVADHPHIGECVTSRVPLCLEDATKAVLTAAEREVVEARGLKTILYLPLIVEDREIGTIIVGTTDTTRCLEASEVDLCLTLAFEIALAVANAQLYEEVREANALLTSHREHLEELVEARTRELSEANEAKSRFLAAMSHELRTPLNSIIGFSGILEREMECEDAAEWQRQAGMIGSSGKHLLEIVDDILDLSKVESGRVDVEPVDFDAAMLVREVVASLEPLAQAKELGYRLELLDEPCLVESDVGLVRQILVNLLGNAIKFTETGTVEVTAGCTDDGVMVTVSDTGPGISEEDMLAVFEPFSQVGLPDGMKPAGTGLGLALSREYAELIGAELSADSVVGQGSTFALLLRSAST